MVNWQNLLEHSGIKTETLDKIRLAQGVVGKSSMVAGFAILGILVIALRLENNWMLLFLAILIAALFFFYFFKILSFANENPELALLEGAELIAWKKMDLAAKGISEPPNENILVSNPDTKNSLTQASLEG